MVVTPISFVVDTTPCSVYDPFNLQDFSGFRVYVGWTYLDGGTNGTSLDYFYQHSTAKFLNRKDACDAIELAKKETK